MAVTQDRPSPYAPASAILAIIEKYRNRGLPSPIDAGVLERAGISSSLVPRTLQALQALDLINDEGRPTQVLEGIRTAPEAEYKNRLAAWLTDAYADALAFVDPATATETDIRDAFRKYTPHGQQDRMVSLFTGLFTAAGVMPERDRKSPLRAKATPAKQRLIYSTPPKARNVKPSLIGNSYTATPGLPPALAGLLQSLPANGQSWTQDARDKFYVTFGAVLDFCVPIGEPAPDPDSFDALLADTNNGD
jgi:hypothetical protein